VEAALFYVAAEGLTNVAKYAHAGEDARPRRAGGRVRRDRDRGRRHRRRRSRGGSGLRGLADRVEAPRRAASAWRARLAAGRSCGPRSRAPARIPMRRLSAHVHCAAWYARPGRRSHPALHRCRGLDRLVDQPRPRLRAAC
jgi:hypothetical protein